MTAARRLRQMAGRPGARKRILQRSFITWPLLRMILTKFAARNRIRAPLACRARTPQGVGVADAAEVEGAKCGLRCIASAVERAATSPQVRPIRIFSTREARVRFFRVLTAGTTIAATSSHILDFSPEKIRPRCRNGGNGR